MPRQAGDLVGQLAKGIPAWPAVRTGHALELLADPGRIPAVGDTSQALELCEGKPERLADVANRATRAIGGEAGDERGVLAAVPLGDADDQPLTDVPGKIEVDVWDRGHLVVDEAPERQAGGDGIDVRETGQVADDRADARPASAPRRQRVSRAAGPAHLEGALARQLEHLPVQQEEARKADSRNQLQLGLEALARASLVPIRVRVPPGEGLLADAA